jgi:hypothetical protein
MTKEKAKKISFHAISVALIVASVLLAIFRFDVVFTRVVQSLGDLWRSVCYYFGYLFEFETVAPTVQLIPDGMEPMLPIEWSEFKAKLSQVWALMQTKENFQLYLSRLGYVASEFLQWFMLLSMPAGTFLLIMYLIYDTPESVVEVIKKKLGIKDDKKAKKDKNGKEDDVDPFELPPETPDGNYNVDSKPLTVYKRIEKALLSPIYQYIASAVTFIRKSVYGKALCWIWFYNLNALTICIEAVAYIFYFAVAIEFTSLYQVFLKLLIDLTVAVGFLPLPVWLVIAYVVIDAIRRRVGVKRLKKYRAINQSLLKEYKGALFFTGLQRASKTTIMTVMAMEQEVIYRDEARDLIAECDKQFPFFPWINVELQHRRSLAEKKIPTLARFREFVDLLRHHFESDRAEGYHAAKKRKALNYLRQAYCYHGSDFIYHYDHERYGTTYNNGISILNVFDVIKNYVQLFKIYAQPTSLIMGNYPIRTDFKYGGEGNFPDVQDTFFKLSPEEAKEISQFCHLYDHDSDRLGRVMDPQGKYKDAVEFGITAMMERGKERGNQITNKGVDGKADECNVNNDLSELNTKIKTHDATVMFFCFRRDLMDEQRADSLGADNKDLAIVFQIVFVDNGRLVLPFFALEEGLNAVFDGIYDKIYDFFRVKHGKNTLLGYLIKRFFQPYHKFYDTIKNRFTVKKADLVMWDQPGKQGTSSELNLYLINWQIFADRFATDGLKGFWHKKALRSEYGLNDVPTFDGFEMTPEQMDKLHSLLYKKLNKIFNGKQEEKSSNKLKK